MPISLTSKIERPMVRAFVEDFYGRVRKNETLGPIFEERLAGHWEQHFEKLTDFWMTVLGGIPAYKGNPFGTHHPVVHEGVHRMKVQHFNIWLDIFATATAATLPEELAEHARTKANRIADSLRQGLFFRAETTAE